jgi:hypothetical protein
MFRLIWAGFSFCARFFHPRSSLLLENCSCHAQYPALDFSHFSFVGQKAWVEKPIKRAVKIATAQPFRS